MSSLIKDISLGLLWLAAGGVYAWLSMQMIKAGVNKLEPGQKTVSVPLLVLGIFLRWALVAVLLYFAVKMHIIYALIFILAFSIMRFILIYKLHRKSNNMDKTTGEG